MSILISDWRGTPRREASRSRDSARRRRHQGGRGPGEAALGWRRRWQWPRRLRRRLVHPLISRTGPLPRGGIFAVPRFHVGVDSAIHGKPFTAPLWHPIYLVPGPMILECRGAEVGRRSDSLRVVGRHQSSLVVSHSRYFLGSSDLVLRIRQGSLTGHEPIAGAGRRRLATTETSWVRDRTVCISISGGFRW